MTRVRIIERTSPTGAASWVIQQKHFLFRWWWVDASINSGYFDHDRDTFYSLDDALRNLYKFDGTKGKEVVIYDSAASR